MRPTLRLDHDPGLAAYFFGSFSYVQVHAFGFGSFQIRLDGMECMHGMELPLNMMDY